MRMSLRRFTRLTSGSSKKLKNHAAIVALYFMYYNFGRVLRRSESRQRWQAGLSDHVRAIEEIVGLLN